MRDNKKRPNARLLLLKDGIWLSWLTPFYDRSFELAFSDTFCEEESSTAFNEFYQIVHPSQHGEDAIPSSENSRPLLPARAPKPLRIPKPKLIIPQEDLSTTSPITRSKNPMPLNSPFLNSPLKVMSATLTPMGPPSHRRRSLGDAPSPFRIWSVDLTFLHLVHFPFVYTALPFFSFFTTLLRSICTYSKNKLQKHYCHLWINIF